MNTEILGWIFGAGVAQGVFLVVALMTLSVRNRDARLLLVLLIGVLTLTLGEEFLDVIGSQLGLGLGLVTEFALWPLLYLFIVSLAEDDPRPLRAHWIHFVPFLAAMVSYFSIYLSIEDPWISLSNPETRQLVASTVLVKAMYFCGYALLILRRPLALSAKPRESRTALRWARRWVWLICAFYGIGMLAFLAFYLELPWAVDSDYIGGLMLVLAIYSLGYFALVNRNLFDARRRAAASGSDPDAGRLAARARDHLESSRAYLEPELSLRGLAEALDVGETRLSQALNEAVRGGFYTLVNDMRLDACLELLDDPDNRDRTVLELAFTAGFSSKATFYRYFRAREGTTPRAYRASKAAEPENAT